MAVKGRIGTAGGSGFSYIGSFTNSIANVAYVFAQDNTGYSLGNAVSHEAGHAFGLQHQSTYDANGVKKSEYNLGDYRNLGTDHGSYVGWHRRPDLVQRTEFPGATVLQDDMAVIAGTTNGFGYRSDDHGNTTATATPLSNAGTTWSGAGIVGTNTDVDMFSFTVAADDTYRIAVNGDRGRLQSRRRARAPQFRRQSDRQRQPARHTQCRNHERANAGQLTFWPSRATGTYGWIGQYSVQIDTSHVARRLQR